MILGCITFELAVQLTLTSYSETIHWIPSLQKLGLTKWYIAFLLSNTFVIQMIEL